MGTIDGFSWVGPSANISAEFSIIYEIDDQRENDEKDGIERMVLKGRQEGIEIKVLY